MARAGITYFDVENAATQLTGQGKNPTIENIRFLLGTGSSTTIAKHLRIWRDKQGETRLISSREKLPEELVALMKGLWENVLNQAQAQITTVKQEANEALATLKQELLHIKHNNDNITQEYNQSKQQIQALNHEKLSQEQAINHLQAEKQSLETNLNMLEQNLANKQERMNELQKINQQVQINLDHYRETVREQRAVEQQQYQQQLKHLEVTSNLYQKEKAELKTKNQTLSDKNEQLQKLSQQLQQEKHSLDKKLSETKTQLDINKTKLDTADELTKDSFTKQQALQGELQEQKKIAQEVQNQVTLLTHALTTTRQQLEDTMLQNKNLAHEKWIIGQEKAQLLGKFEQLEHTMRP